MRKFFKAVLFLISTLQGQVFAQDLSNTSIGFQSGYTSLSSFNAVSLNNAFPIAINLQYKFSHHLQTKFEYQWIHSEQSEQSSVNLSSFRLIPGYQFYQRNDHGFQINTGLGYQYANFSGLDTVRHLEWSIGPSWSWYYMDGWSLSSNVNYSRSLNASFQHIDFGVGISFQFGTVTSYEHQNFVDIDQDGVTDEIDECSATPFGVKVSKTGCPKDNDQDAVADYLDFCPGTETEMEIDDLGCPIMNIARGVIDGIAFEGNGPRLTSDSKTALLPIAENLKKFPNLLFLIEGHSATANTNQRLMISKARARAVMNILISYGVPVEKLQAVGLGNQYPLTTSNEVQDRILNERIEIKWKAFTNKAHMHASNQ